MDFSGSTPHFRLTAYRQGGYTIYPKTGRLAACLGQIRFPVEKKLRSMLLTVLWILPFLRSAKSRLRMLLSICKGECQTRICNPPSFGENNELMSEI